MHILHALEEYMESSKNFPMIPHIIKKIIKTRNHSPNTIKIKSGNTEKIPQKYTDNFQPAKNNTFKLSPLTDTSDQTVSNLIISNNQIPCFLGKEEYACIPIISNGKWMGVIVTDEENANSSHLSKKESLLEDLNKQPSTSIQDNPFHIDGCQSADSEIVSIPSEKVRSVLHEVNTPLSIIKNYIHILGDKLSKQNIAKDEIRIIKEEIDRISHLLNTLHVPSADKAEKAQPININTQVIDLVKIMREPLAKHSKVKFKLNIENKLPAICAEKNSIKQIFINLIKNSMDAMPNGGCLTIQTRYIQHPSKDKNSVAFQDPKGSLEITVSDNGVGIPPEIESRIFQPFISSKKNEHSGMGLAIVQNIVKSLHGTITCKNNEDNGATFKINFPLYNSMLCNHEIPA